MEFIIDQRQAADFVFVQDLKCIYKRAVDTNVNQWANKLQIF